MTIVDVGGPSNITPVIATVANPSAGADFSWTSPSSQPVLLKYVTATLTTAVAVASRNPTLKLTIGGTVAGQWPTANAQAASLAVVWTFSEADDGAFISAVAAHVPVPSNFWLPPSSVVASVTGGIQAADQWSAIAFTYLRGAS